MKGIREQFAFPTGPLGFLVGHLMAFKNADRGRWVVAQLDLQPDSSVLEIGVGPGADLRRVAMLAPRGRIAGIDPSREMLRQARARNPGGRIDLREGIAAAIPFDDASFDRAYSINTVQFWDDLSVGLAEMARVLRPGGLAAVAIEPRNRGASADDTLRWADRLDGAMRDVGFEDVRRTMNETKRVPTVCVTGRV